MTQLWYIVAPELSTNVVLNPSAERDGNYTTNGTVTRSNAFAFSGFYSYLCSSFTATKYLRLTVPALANETHTISLSAYATDDITGVRVSVDGVNYYTIGADFTLWDGAVTDSNGARYYRTFSKNQCNGATYIEILGPAAGTVSFYIDGIQCEALQYATTYIDCDTQGCFANGERHASTSFRSSQERSGGRVLNLDTYSATVGLSSNRFGMAPMVNNSQPLALQPGAEYLGYRTLPREISLAISLSGSSLANLHALRNTIIGVTQPDSVRDEQAFLLGYQGSNSVRKAWIKVRYVSGLEFMGADGFLETTTLRVIALDPFAYEWGVTSHALAFTQTITNPYFTRRKRAGEWEAISVNNAVYALAYDYERGRVYLGGAFTTNGGALTLNYMAYWDGTSLNAMYGAGATIAGVNGAVYTIAIAPNGDVWFGGAFTRTAPLDPLGADLPTNGLVKYDVSANTILPVLFGSGTVTEISAIATDKNGLLYVAGNFTNVGGANGDHIITWDGTTASALSTGSTHAVQNVIVASDGTVYALSLSATAMGGVSGTYAWKWNGTAFTALGFSGTQNGVLNSLFEGEDGMIYFPGLDDLWRWNGNSLIQLYDFGQTVIAFTPYQRGSALVSLNSPATTLGSDYHLIWNGTSIVPPDFRCAGNNQIRTIAIQPNTEERNEPEIFAAHNSAFTQTFGDTVTLSANCTAKTYPVFLITGPTTAGASCRLQFIQNVTTGETLNLSLSVNEGEYAIVDCRTGVKGVFSAWSGRPGGQGVFTRSTDLTGSGLNAGAGRRIAGQPLPASQFGSWHLQPGSNIIGAFVSGTTTGVTLTMAYTPKHLGVDGVA